MKTAKTAKTAMRLLTLALVGAGTMLSAGTAHAVYVNFREAVQSPADDLNNDGTPRGDKQWTKTILGDITVTITSAPATSRLYWDSTDGFGVQDASYEDDEIEGIETLFITFSRAVNLWKLDLTDLFYEGNPKYKEKGWYRFKDGEDASYSAQQYFYADTSQVQGTTNGELTVSLLGKTATHLMFGAPGHVNDQNHEYSVAGIGFIAAPELSSGASASAIALLVAGALLIADRRRRSSALPL